MSKVNSQADTESNPHLFRLSLPEWLKEQVNSGKHKDVYWIDEEEKIFHVPWKHASRNGWDMEDVSLFKAWAIYTKRYREGIDEAKPALWKTNFRCAINSHNSIIFIKDQGERKGDKAHRIMQIIKAPKRVKKKDASCPLQIEQQSPRKLVRLTYPNHSAGSRSDQTSSKERLKDVESMITNTVHCQNCNEVKLQIKNVFEKIIEENSSCENSEFLTFKAKFMEIMSLKEHICTHNNLAELFEENNSKKIELEPLNKPNLNDLYNVGKALQSKNDNENIKTEIITDDVIENTQTYMNENGEIYIAIQNCENEDEVSLVLVNKDQLFIKNEDLNDDDDNETENITPSSNEDLENIIEVSNEEQITANNILEEANSEIYFAEKQKQEEDELIKPRD